MRYKLALAALVLVLVGSLAWSTMHYRDNAISYKKQRDDYGGTIDTMQKQQVSVAVLDAKYTQELRDAQDTIDQLSDAVDAGTKRLSVRAKCVSKAAGTSGVGDAGTAELDAAARQDYYRLREQMILADKQIRYLQDYIRDEFNVGTASK
ncbi:Bacteriophage lysis protein [compost metagenome]